MPRQCHPPPGELFLLLREGHAYLVRLFMKTTQVCGPHPQSESLLPPSDKLETSARHKHIYSSFPSQEPLLSLR